MEVGECINIGSRQFCPDCTVTIVNYLCQSVCLPDCLSVCLLGCLCVNLSVYLTVCLHGCLSVCQSVCLPDCLPICQSDSLPVNLTIPVCMSVCLSICLLFKRNLELEIKLYLSIRPRGYKAWVHSQTQNKAQWLAACGHVSTSSQSLRFILSLSLYSSFIASRPDWLSTLLIVCL